MGALHPEQSSQSKRDKQVVWQRIERRQGPPVKGKNENRDEPAGDGRLARYVRVHVQGIRFYVDF
jgi:hypothetical protein